MKKLLFLLSMTFFTTNVFSQKVWHSEVGSIAGPRFNVLSSCKDTTINSEVWTILETSFAGILPPPRIFDSIGYIYRAGMILEKNGIVEFMDMTGRTRQVLYDYNLQLGDTLRPGTGAEMIVTKVDNILILNENKRRITLYNAEYDYDDVWIEGIGSVKNYFLSPGEPKYVPDSGSDLICMSIDGQLAHVTDFAPDQCLFDYYPNFDFPCSNSPTNASKELGDLNLDLKVFPNPFNEIINIESAIPFQKIEILDLNGRLLFSKKNLNQISTLKIESPPLPNAIYVLKVFGEDGNIGRQMILRNK